MKFRDTYIQFYIFLLFTFLALIAAPTEISAFSDGKPGFSDQDQSEPVTQFQKALFVVERALTTEDGMPANGVNRLIQDSRGYIWAATYNGLVRYDGHRKRIFSSSNVDGLESNRFLELFEDSRGRIWAGLEYNYLVMVDGNRTEVYYIDDSEYGYNNHVTNISEGVDGRIWVGTSRGLMFIKDGEFHRNEQLPRNSVQQTIHDGESIYVLLHNELYRMNLDGSRLELLFELNEDGLIQSQNYVIPTLTKTGNLLSDFFLDGDDLVIISHAGIVRAGVENYEVLLHRDDVGQRFIFSLKEQDGRTFLFGSEGLMEVEGIGAGSLKVQRYTDFSTVDLLFDHEGSVWIATSTHGIRQYVSTPVYQGQKYDILNGIAVMAVLKDRSDVLWTGTNCDGIYRFTEDGYTRFGSDEGVQNTCIWSLMEQSDGTMWAGSWGGGVFKKSIESNEFKSFEVESIESFSAILSIFEDSAGSIWFGSYFDGLFRYKDDQLEEIKNMAGEPVSAVRMFYEDDSGRLWLASDRGIGYVENNQVVKPDELQVLQTRNFRKIVQDDEGRFWFGSYGGGILIYSPGQDLKTLTEVDGLFDNTISQLTFDSQGNVWLAGNLGVFFIENEQVQEYLEGNIDQVRVSRLGVSEGLAIRETTGGFMPSIFLDIEDRLYIPTVQGLSEIHLNRFSLNRDLPKVHIEEISLDDKQVYPEDLDRIAHDTQRLVFRFTALSFQNPGYMQFQYKIEGFDDQWQKAGEMREAVYTSLKPGDYNFQVRASNNDGFWTEEAIDAAFTIVPPFWRTIWFYLFSVLLLAGCIGLGYRIRMRNIQKRTRQLEDTVQSRTQELRVANGELKKHIEEKNKLHSILAHDLRNPFSAILGYMEILKEEFQTEENHEHAEIVENIINASHNTHNLLENLLHWSGTKSEGMELIPEKMKINQLVEEAVSMVQPQARFKNIDVITNSSGDYTVCVDKDMILSVVRNLVSNAVKYSGSGSVVSVDINGENSHVSVSVTDSGVGISREELEILFEDNISKQKLGTQGERGIGLGLALCREFIELHNGTLDVESTEGEGSTFTFTLENNGECDEDLNLNS